MDQSFKSIDELAKAVKTALRVNSMKGATGWFDWGGRPIYFGDAVFFTFQSEEIRGIVFSKEGTTGIVLGLNQYVYELEKVVGYGCRVMTSHVLSPDEAKMSAQRQNNAFIHGLLPFSHEE